MQHEPTVGIGHGRELGAGEQGLEKSVFASVFTQIGKRLTQSTIKGAVPLSAALSGPSSTRVIVEVEIEASE